MGKLFMPGTFEARGSKYSPSSSEAFLLCHGHCMSAAGEARLPQSRPSRCYRRPSIGHLLRSRPKRGHAPRCAMMSSGRGRGSYSEDVSPLVG